MKLLTCCLCMLLRPDAAGTDTGVAARAVALLGGNRLAGFAGLAGGIDEKTGGATAPATAPSAAPPKGVARAADWLQLDRAIDEGRWPEAEERFRQMERLGFPDQHPRIRWCRVRLNALRDEQTELGIYLRVLLLEHAASSAQLRALVVELRTKGHQESALTVAREVSRLLPEARWANRLVREIDAELKLAPLKQTRMQRAAPSNQLESVPAHPPRP